MGEGGGHCFVLFFNLDLKAFPLQAKFNSVCILLHLRASIQLNADAPCMLWTLGSKLVEPRVQPKSAHLYIQSAFLSCIQNPNHSVVAKFKIYCTVDHSQYSQYCIVSLLRLGSCMTVLWKRSLAFVNTHAPFVLHRVRSLWIKMWKIATCRLVLGKGVICDTALAPSCQ